MVRSDDHDGESDGGNGAGHLSADPPSQAEHEDDVGAAEDGVDETEVSPEGDDEVTQLRALVLAMEDELAARDRKLREYIEAHQHAVQEMDAARKRMKRDREEEVDRDRSTLAAAMLEVVDDMDRSLQSGASTSNVTALLEGVALVRNRVMQKLGALGVEQMDCLGARFDPNVHEAVGMIPVPDEDQDQRIVAEEQSGFLFKGKLLRAARVIVGTHTGS